MTTDANTPSEGTPDGSIMALPVHGTVLASDGELVGKVKEVSGGYFKVDASMAMDYWLSRAYVATVAGDAVHLAITKHEASKHRLAAPGLEHATTGGDGIITNEAALEQRERMERELEEQKARMRIR